MSDSAYNDFVKRLKGQIPNSGNETGAEIPTDHNSLTPITQEDTFEVNDYVSITEITDEASLPDALKGKQLGQTMTDAIDNADKKVEDAIAKEKTAKANLDEFLSSPPDGKSEDNNKQRALLESELSKAQEEKIQAESERDALKTKYSNNIETSYSEILKLQKEHMDKEPISDLKDSIADLAGATKVTDDAYLDALEKAQEKSDENIKNLDDKLNDYLTSGSEEDFTADELNNESLLEEIKIFGQNEAAQNSEHVDESEIAEKHNLADYVDEVVTEIDLGDNFEEESDTIEKDIEDLVNKIDEAFEGIQQATISKARLAEILDFTRMRAYSIKDALDAKSYAQSAEAQAEIERVGMLVESITNDFIRDMQMYVDEDYEAIEDRIKQIAEKSGVKEAQALNKLGGRYPDPKSLKEVDDFYKALDKAGEDDFNVFNLVTLKKYYQTHPSEDVLESVSYSAESNEEKERKAFIEFFNNWTGSRTVYANSFKNTGDGAEAWKNVGNTWGDLMKGVLLSEMDSLLSIFGGPVSAVLNKLNQNAGYSIIKKVFSDEHKKFYYEGKLDKHTDSFKKSEIFDFTAKGLLFPDGTRKMVNFPIFSTNYNVMFQIQYRVMDEAWGKIFKKNNKKLGAYLLDAISGAAELLEVQALAKLMSQELNVRLDGITFPAYQQETKEKHRGNRAVKVPVPHADRETKHSLTFTLDEDGDVINFFCGTLYNYFKPGHLRPTSLNIVVSPHQYEHADNFYGRVFVFKNVRFYTYKIINNFEKGADAKKAKFDFVCESVYTINQLPTTDVEVDMTGVFG